MKTKWGIAVLVAASGLLIGISTVLAGPPLAVHIEVEEQIGASGEPFSASGPAVDAGLLCASGTVDDLSIKVSGPPNGDFRILRVLKRFHCTGGTGTFDARLVVRLDLATHQTTATWTIFGGTAAYAGVHGIGSLIGTPIVPGVSILDVYDGGVH